jgi:type III secretion protein J
MEGMRTVRYNLQMTALYACVLLSGCQVDLYTALTEREANAMLAILTTNGISARKEHAGDAGVTVFVNEADLARAIDILTANGLPRDEKQTMGEVFKKNGIMSSPFEERVRYVYALEESIAKTIGEIDGILSARVHIVLPENASRNMTQKPSSVAVFIKHRRGVDLDFFTPQIRRLVSNAIEGVLFEAVTVASVEAEPPQVLGSQMRTPIIELVPGLGVRAEDARHFWTILVIASIVAAGLVVSNLFSVFAYMKARGSRKSANAGGDGATGLEE